VPRRRSESDPPRPSERETPGSHFLILHSAQHPESFHRAAILELCRVAREVRVFPLTDLPGGASPHVEPVLRALRGSGVDAEVVRVGYEFRRGANQMLRIRR
jgi:hypothetical protein